MLNKDEKHESIRSLYAFTRCKVYGKWPELTTLVTPESVHTLIDHFGKLSFEAILKVVSGPELESLGNELEEDTESVGEIIPLFRHESAFYRGNIAYLEWNKGEHFLKNLSRGLKAGEIDVRLEFRCHDNNRLAESFPYLAGLSEIAAHKISRLTGGLIVPRFTNNAFAVYDDKILSLFDVTLKPIKILTRPVFQTDDLISKMQDAANGLNKLNKTIYNNVIIAIRRVNSGLMENDPIDAFCDFWEACEFLSTTDENFSGHSYRIMAERLAHHILPQGSVKARKDLAHDIEKLAVSPMYKCRKDIVHRGVNDKALVDKGNIVLEEIALLLIDHWTGVEFEAATQLASLGITIP